MGLFALTFCGFCALSSFSHQELSLRLAEKEDAKVVVATDPDADRLAVAEQQEK